MRKNEGFTIFELLMVIAIIGIISAVAIPNFMSALPRRRLNQAVQELHNDLQRARLAAVKDRENCAVTFGLSSYTIACTSINKTVDLSRYGSNVHFERPQGCSGNVTPAGGITFTAQGMSTINGYAYLTNGVEEEHYRVGALSSGVVAMDTHVGGCTWN